MNVARSSNAKSKNAIERKMERNSPKNQGPILTLLLGNVNTLSNINAMQMKTGFILRANVKKNVKVFVNTNIYIYINSNSLIVKKISKYCRIQDIRSLVLQIPAPQINVRIIQRA